MSPATFRTQIFIIIATILLISIMFRFIRKSKLREEYILIWTFSALGMLFFSFNRRALDWLADLCGVQYAPALLLIIGGLAFLVFVAHISVVVSGFQSDIKNLSHEVALLKEKLERAEKTKE